MKRIVAGLALALGLGAQAYAQQAPTQPARLPGFLSGNMRPDAYATIPPAPKEGDARNDADWAIFRATRALEGSERWALALADDALRPADLLRDFSCAVGAQLTAENAPALARILARATVDAGGAAEGAKQIYKRTRPFQHNPGNICLADRDRIARSYDYPSGHASLGWTGGLIIAELAPDRATQIMARARAFGESRIVCGVHNYSAVDAGRVNGAGVYAALHGSAEFREAMIVARQEIDAARTSGAKPDAAACAKEFELTRPLAVQ